MATTRSLRRRSVSPNCRARAATGRSTAVPMQAHSVLPKRRRGPSARVSAIPQSSLNLRHHRRAHSLPRRDRGERRLRLDREHRCRGGVRRGHRDHQSGAGRRRGMGLGISFHMSLVLFMVMGRVFALTKNRVNRARAGDRDAAAEAQQRGLTGRVTQRYRRQRIPPARACGGRLRCTSG
jgi:hypothetical protein